jgi:hypothetical protein
VAWRDRGSGGRPSRPALRASDGLSRSAGPPSVSRPGAVHPLRSERCRCGFAVADSGLMAKRKRRQPREKAPTVDYSDAEGNVLTLRESLSAGTIAKIGEGPATAATTQDDAWRRRSELLFERLVVRWEIAGLPLADQKMLLGRYRMADAETQRWVRETIDTHLERHIPELAG